MATSGVDFRRVWKILAAAFVIASSHACINPAIENTNSRIPALESDPGRPPSADPARVTLTQEGNAPEVESPDSAEPLEPSPSDTGEITRTQTLARDVDRTGSVDQLFTHDDKEKALNRALYLCELSQMEWKRGELEKAVETLDQAYALLLRVDPENNPIILQEKEDLRVAISRRMLEIYSSRMVAVNSNHRKEIPIPINKHVQDEINAFATGREKDFFLSSYRRSGRYRLKIEAALQAAGLPTELSWLPLVESGFKVTALSPARALGLWQFIPSTGYRYNLNRNKYIDERLDAEKSTRSAIEYLKELHEMFGDWTTVLAAYNCGEHRVLRTIQSQQINYLDNFWDLYERLPRETARYVPRFLATLHIVQNLERYGLSEVAIDPPLQYESVTLSKQTSLKSIARTTGIDGEWLKELNAELRRGILPADGYDLRVPVGTGSLVAAHTDDFQIHRIMPVSSKKTHKVKRGETLRSIGKRYGISTKRLMAANGIHKPKRLQAGAVLRIPGNYSSEKHARASKRTPHRVEIIEYVVQPGDSLFKIAKRFATTTEKIQRLNKMSTTGLSVGQILKIQTAADTAGEA